MPHCSLQAGGPPGQAPPRLPARRVLQLGEKGSCPGGRLSEPEAAAGLDFRIIPGSAPEGGVYPV